MRTLLALLLVAVLACRPTPEIPSPKVADVAIEELATQVRIITSWTVPAGAAYDSIRVQVAFGSEPIQNKLKAGTATRDTTLFSLANVPAGASVGGQSNIQGFRRALSSGPTTVNYNFVRGDAPPPPVTGASVAADTTGL